MKTGCKDLDNLIEYKDITMIYGEAATGKTTLAKLAAIEQAKNNKKVIFIDAENGFSIERLGQLSGKDYEKVLGNIIILKPRDFDEQKKYFKKLIDIVENSKISLIIVDTIGVHYRSEVKKDYKNATKAINYQMKILKWASKKNIPIILTNQVYSNLENKIINVGGNMIKNLCNCIIKLDKDPRKLIVEKPNNKEILFDIKEDGIVKI